MKRKEGKFWLTEYHIHALLDLSKLKGHNYFGENYCNKCTKNTKWYAVYARQCSECSACGNCFYPMKGTIFEKTTLSLYTWIECIKLVHEVKITNIRELQKKINVTYKTAWRMFYRTKVLTDYDVEYKLYLITLKK